MSEYPKIQTLFERDKQTFVVDPARIKSPVLETISSWDVTEKIDGMNIRVTLSPAGEVSFAGRTDKAQLPGDLVQHLARAFPPDKLKTLWIDDSRPEIILFGEGYGPGIQKNGGLYRADKAFILFDVLVGGKWWMNQDVVNATAQKLGIDAVPYLGRRSLTGIIELVRVPFASLLGSAQAEGIVARPIETLFDRNGERIIIKLKTKDFVAGKR